MSVTTVHTITQHWWIKDMLSFSNNYILPIRDDYDAYTMSVKFPSATDVSKLQNWVLAVPSLYP